MSVWTLKKNWLIKCHLNNICKYKPFFRKDESVEDGYWLDENTWFDHDNKVKKAVAKNLSTNQWVKEAKRQEGELQEAKVFDINMKQA